jgi:hypothetical protein
MAIPTLYPTGMSTLLEPLLDPDGHRRAQRAWEDDVPDTRETRAPVPEVLTPIPIPVPVPVPATPAVVARPVRPQEPSITARVVRPVVARVPATVRPRVPTAVPAPAPRRARRRRQVSEEAPGGFQPRARHWRYLNALQACIEVGQVGDAAVAQRLGLCRRAVWKMRQQPEVVAWVNAQLRSRRTDWTRELILQRVMHRALRDGSIRHLRFLAHVLGWFPPRECPTCRGRRGMVAPGLVTVVLTPTESAPVTLEGA